MDSNIDKKLAEIPEAERERYLKGKFRELQLIHRLDKITDRYSRLPRLMEKSLALMRSFFGVEIAAAQLTGAEKLENEGFFFAGDDSSHDGPPGPVKELLNQFLAEPQVEMRRSMEESMHSRAGIRNVLIIPMVITSEIAGAFLLANREEVFTDADVHFLKVFSSQLDNAVVHARVLDDYRKLARDLKQRVRQLNVLYEMSLSLGVGFDFESLAKRIFESTQQLVHFDRCSVMFYDQKADELKTEVVLGEKQKIRLVRLSAGKGIAGLSIRSKRPILAEHGADDERFVPFEFQGIKIRKIHSLICIPLFAEEKPLGVMNFSMLTRKRVFQPKDLETLGVAAHMVSMALQRQQFYQLSIKDELTGLYSFRYFKERLHEEVSRARRYRMVAGLIIFDIDHFKKVNDTYGHPFGNVVLKKVAQVINNSIRSGVDMPARFGGEEMAVILPHTNEHGAYILADRIRQRVEALDFDCDGKQVKVTISGGVSGFPTHAEDGEILLKKADEALYAAKQNGRNRVVLAP